MVLLVVNFLTSPPSDIISFTNFEEIIWFSIFDIKKIVSILLFSFLFIPASWNSYSKSDTALNPLNIILDLCFLHKSVVRDLKDTILIFFLLSLRSENNAFLIISILSLELNK